MADKKPHPKVTQRRRKARGFELLNQGRSYSSIINTLESEGFGRVNKSSVSRWKASAAFTAYAARQDAGTVPRIHPPRPTGDGDDFARNLRSTGNIAIAAHRSGLPVDDALDMLRSNADLLREMASPAAAAVTTLLKLTLNRDGSVPHNVQRAAAVDLLRASEYWTPERLHIAVGPAAGRHASTVELLTSADRARLAREAAEVDLMPPLDAVEVSNG